METPKASPGLNSPSPSSNGALQPLWRPHWLWWLISALSGTLSIEEDIVMIKQDRERLRQETARLKLENEKYDAIVQQNQTESLQVKNDIEQIENEALQVKNDIEQIESETLRVKNETEQIEKDNARFIELLSKVDALLRSFDSNSTPKA